MPAGKVVESETKKKELLAQAFQIAEWSEEPRGFLEVTVSSPAVKHEVSISKLTNWLQSSGRSPRELVQKSRLKEILGWKAECID